ncbi:MAG TPA: DMT family transporter [Anaerolineales bacterium]|nr:DMT family transporter [Anaerolineales bacterium]
MRREPLPVALPFALALAIGAVSTASIFIRLAQAGAPSITIAALRLGIATACLAPIALSRHRRELRSLGRRELALAFVAGGFLAIHFATWITSLEYTTVASSVVLVSTGPLWVGLISPLLLQERMTPATIWGLALALLGGIVIALGGACTLQTGLRCTPPNATAGALSLWGNFLALAGAWAVSGYLVIGRRLRPRLSLIPYVFLVYGCAACVLLSAAILSGAPIMSLSAQTYLWIALLALVPQLVGHSTYNWALRYLPAAVVAVTTLGEPIGSAMLAFIILNERPAAFVLAGAVLILAGIYLAARGAQAPAADSA